MASPAAPHGCIHYCTRRNRCLSARWSSYTCINHVTAEKKGLRSNVRGRQTFQPKPNGGIDGERPHSPSSPACREINLFLRVQPQRTGSFPAGIPTAGRGRCPLPFRPARETGGRFQLRRCQLSKNIAAADTSIIRRRTRFHADDQCSPSVLLPQLLSDHMVQRSCGKPAIPAPPDSRTETDAHVGVRQRRMRSGEVRRLVEVSGVAYGAGHQPAPERP